MTNRLGALSRDLAIYGLGEIAVKAFSFITVPIYTRLFSPAEYGVFGYVSTAAGLVSAVLILGGDSAYARYYFAASSDEERRSITTTWIGFLAVWAVSGVLVLLPLTPTLADSSFGDPGRSGLFVAAFLAAPVSLVNRMCGQILRNRFQATAFTVLNLGSVGLSVALAVLAAAGLGLGLQGVFLGVLAAELVILPVRLWSTRQMFKGRVSLAVLRRLLVFGIPLVPTSVAYWVFLTSDRIILAQLSTLDQVGLYSIAVGLVAVPSVAIAAVGQAWIPHAIEAFERDRDEARKLVADFARYLVAGFGLLAVGVTAMAQEGLLVLTTDDYLPAAAAVAPLALAMVAQASTSVTALGITLSKRTTYLAIAAWGAAFVNVLLNLLLDGRFGMTGAAWATAVSYALLTGTYLVVSQRLWRVEFPRRAIGGAVGLTAMFVVGATMIPSMPFLLALPVKGAYCLAFVAGLGLLGVVSPSEWSTLRRALRTR